LFFIPFQIFADFQYARTIPLNNIFKETKNTIKIIGYNIFLTDSNPYLVDRRNMSEIHLHYGLNFFYLWINFTISKKYFDPDNKIKETNNPNDKPSFPSKTNMFP